MRGIVRLADIVTAITRSASLACAATDKEQLQALHEKVMRAHRESRPALLLEDEARDNVVANRGQVKWPSVEERRQDFESYLGSTRFEEYSRRKRFELRVAVKRTVDRRAHRVIG